jgi:chromosome segregation protein
VRLTTIRLSGFKSFAEPTQFELPGQLVGVVGPNGCGKSNIIDAVRWVLGESRASELRGESMQDVIFNGSTSRKPAGRASVELVFDNSDRRAGGQWNAYSEISVKRVLTRDGTSSYFINGQSVRRRDVQDVFLGTGLGPRAYAIIGQGTINRILESKPEELRLFLEEAAGVSKYKERRRETENRLADTRENLTRVQDILRELNANLERLERQAEVAQRYHALQSEVTKRQQQLWYLKRQESAAERARLAADVGRFTLELEGQVSELRRVEADLEQIRQAHYAAGDQVNQAQGRLYEVTAEVGRLEAEIRFVTQSRQRAAERLQQIEEQRRQWAQRAEDASAELEGLAEQSAIAEDRAAVLQEQVQESERSLPELEDAWRQALGRVEEQRAAVALIQQQIQVLAAEQRSLGEQLRQLQSRRERLESERRSMGNPDPQAVQQLELEVARARACSTEAEQRLAALQAQLPELDEQRALAQKNAQLEAERQTESAARLQALKSLQDKLKVDGQLQPWLEKQGLQSLPALWTRLNVEPGWETAVESALRERMGALEVSELERVRAFENDPPPVRLAFYSAQMGAEVESAAGAGRALIDALRLPDAALRSVMHRWLRGCWRADTLREALDLRAQLPPGGCVYTRDGHGVDSAGVIFYAPDHEQAGLLARAQEIENLERAVRAQGLLAEEARSAYGRADAAWRGAQQELDRARQDARAARDAAHAAELRWMQLTQQLEQSRAKARSLEDDLAEVDAAIEEILERQAAAEARFESLDMQLGEAQERLILLQDRGTEAERALQAAREQLRGIERQVQEAVFAQRSVAARQAELSRIIETAQMQIQALAEEAARLEAERVQFHGEAAERSLQQALDLKLEREAALAAARSAYDDLTQRLRAADERRLKLEHALEPLRTRITELQLKEQAAQLGEAQYEQYLTEAGADLEALAQSIQNESVRLAGLQGEIDRLGREIAALGAVNLAALDELGAARERKAFLDSQSADLGDAMQTLEDAIRKIDTETRALLAQTFEAVNEHFGRMFPELFGGGQARLVMTGEEILDAGVQVMAQPPGKKNQTIHLLSGGEKALTAIALVFAIFQLNPAPFCLLDEVDAPLDDANTERYAKLVRRMSRDTQFLFISHNKIAMEMAEQLIGVTMQEQGVSRIVAVDMSEAATLAAA